MFVNICRRWSTTARRATQLKSMQAGQLARRAGPGRACSVPVCPPCLAVRSEVAGLASPRRSAVVGRAASHRIKSPTNILLVAVIMILSTPSHQWCQQQQQQQRQRRMSILIRPTTVTTRIPRLPSSKMLRRNRNIIIITNISAYNATRRMLGPSILAPSW